MIRDNYINLDLFPIILSVLQYHKHKFEYIYLRVYNILLKKSDTCNIN